MSGLSTGGESVVLNALLAARFVSLHTGDPGDTGLLEVTGGAYARQVFAVAYSGNNPTVGSNSAVIQFPTATAPWGNIQYFGLWSAVSAGTFLGGWPVTTPKPIDIEDTARWNVGTLKIGTDEPLP